LLHYNLVCAATALVGCSAFAQSLGNCTQRVVVGSSTTDAGDGGPAENAELYDPQGIARDGLGNLYIADTYNNKVRVVGPDKIIRAYAGTGVAGSAGDGGPALAAQLDHPTRVAIGPGNAVYILETNRVRRVRQDGVIEAVAGQTGGGFSGDGGPAIAAKLLRPFDIALDGSGNLYISDTGNRRVRRVDPAGTITTFAGSGRRRPDSTGEGQPAVTAYLEDPRALAVAPDGTLYLVNYGPVYAVAADGILRRIAGSTSMYTYPADGVQALDARLIITALAFDPAGHLGILNDWGTSFAKLFTIDAEGKLNQVLYTSGTNKFLFRSDHSIDIPSGSRIWNVAPGATISYNLLAGRWLSSDPDGPVSGPAGGFLGFSGLASDAAGNIFIADLDAGKIRRYSPDGVLTTVAGKGNGPNVSPDGTPALAAELLSSQAPAIGPAGELYFADFFGSLIRKVAADGTLMTVAGNGQSPDNFPDIDGKPALQVAIQAQSLAFDSNGVLYFVDKEHAVIWRVTTDGVLHRATEKDSSLGYVSADLSGNVYTILHSALWKFDSNGAIQRVRPLPFLSWNWPYPFAVDGDTNVYVVDPGNYRVYKFGDGPASVIEVAAGTDLVQSSAHYIALDRSGNLFLTDIQRNRLAEIPNATTCAASMLPSIPPGGVVDAASYNGQFAPGSLVTVFGQLVGPATPAGGVIQSGKFQTRAGNTEVWINGAPAPVIYASSGQTSAIVPFDAGEGDSATLQVRVGDFVSNQTKIWISDTAAAIFTQDSSGKGPGAILNQDYSVNTTANPAEKGSVVMVFLTGLGALRPPLDDGELAPAQVSQHTSPVTATLDGQPVEVLYAGTAPGIVAGVSQVNLRVPADAASGAGSLLIDPVPNHLHPVTIQIR
jgi:uncharacterized protein (TIGR03437 family)